MPIPPATHYISCPLQPHLLYNLHCNFLELGIAIETTILARFCKMFWFKGKFIVTLKSEIFFAIFLPMTYHLFHAYYTTTNLQFCNKSAFYWFLLASRAPSWFPAMHRWAWKQISKICCEISQHLKLAIILKIIQTFTPETLLPTCFVINSHHMYKRIQLFQIIIETYTKWAVTDIMDRLLRSAGQVCS